MIDIQMTQTYLLDMVDKAKKFDYTRLIPRLRWEKYAYGTAGIEFTWRVGPGIGLGLGVFDLWVGWPRHEENLHTADCKHEPPKPEIIPVVG